MFYRPRLGAEAIVGTAGERAGAAKLGIRAVAIGATAWGVVVISITAWGVLGAQVLAARAFRVVGRKARPVRRGPAA